MRSRNPQSTAPLRRGDKRNRSPTWFLTGNRIWAVAAGRTTMIFLSYSWKTQPAAHRVVEALSAERLPCWVDEQQLDGGDELRVSLRTAISQSDVFLYLNSDAANKSKNVQDELRFAIGLESEGKLRIVPVRLADSTDSLPPLLSDRIYISIDPTCGGAAHLAHKLTEIDGHSRIPDSCRLSATVRLEEHRLVHTLAQTRELLADHPVGVHVLLLDAQYEAIDSLYWQVDEVQFPLNRGTPRELTDTIGTIANIQGQSREIIKEVRMICRRFLDTSRGAANQYYYDAGHERIIRVLLHRLQWNSTYLQYLRDSQEVSGPFINACHLPAPFDGHRCDFVSRGRKLGSVTVPEYGHPFPSGIKELTPWGLTNPFDDLLQEEVGVALGEILALRFMGQSIQTTELPCPESVTYGLS